MIQNRLKTILFSFVFATLSHAVNSKKNLTVNLSHLASSLTTRGAVIHLEKGVVGSVTHTAGKLGIRVQECESQIHEHMFK